MSVVLQDIVVGVLVGGCVLFSAWRLATVRARLKVLEALEGLPALGRGAWLARLRAHTLARSTAACGGCSQAKGTERTTAAMPDAASPNRTRGALRR
jgi:hypothetical protein